jgi:DMSO/TMAO reductase YedYZ molybdopterin-dependent catalytic subunit
MRSHTRITVLTRRDLLARIAAVAGASALVACAEDASDKEGTDPVDTGVLPTENRNVVISPISSNEEHYVTSCCRTPTIDPTLWTLAITQTDDAGVITPITAWTLDALRALPARDREHTLMCIGANPNNQRISNAIWSGLPMTEVLAALGVTVPEGSVAIRFDAGDEYSTALPISDLDLPIWLVWQMNGTDLPPEHGFPVRLLVPSRYGMKNPKWITGMSFLTQPYLGYWETRGWSDTAEYRPNTLIRYPRDSDVVVDGPLRVVGTAYAGSDPIVSVEVSLDGGAWQRAEIEYQNGPDTWALWSFTLDVSEGTHTIQARCTTASGRMSDPAPLPPFDGGGYGGSMLVTNEVL